MSRCMKVVCLAAAVLSLPVTAHASEIDPAVVQLWDVVHVADGSVLKGVIVEEVPGTSLRIVLVGGSSIVVPIADVVRLTRELNPGFARPELGQAAEAPVSPPSPAKTAESGLRIGLMPGIAFHTAGEGDPTFVLTSRVGWEIGMGPWGLTPGVVVDLLPDVGIYGGTGVAVMGGARAAYRATTVSPFVGFGIGADFASGNALSLAMSGGVDLVLHRRFALSAEAKFHRGFGGMYTTSLSYASLGIGIEIRL